MKLRLLLAVPLAAFLILFGLSLLRGRPSLWHTRCAELWRTQDWKGLQNLASNLDHLGTPDPEAEYYAALASIQMKDAESAQTFAGKWVDRKALNWKWETDLAPAAKIKTPLDKLRLYRVRSTAILLLILIPLNILSIRKTFWNVAGSLLALAGIAILLI